MPDFTEPELYSKLLADLELVENDSKKNLTDEITRVILRVIEIVKREKVKFLK